MSEKRITVVEHARKAGRTLEQLQASEAEVTRLKGLLKEAKKFVKLGIGWAEENAHIWDQAEIYIEDAKAFLAKLPR